MHKAPPVYRQHIFLMSFWSGMATYKASKNIFTPQKSAKNPREETQIHKNYLHRIRPALRVALQMVSSVPKMNGKSNISPLSFFEIISGKKSKVC